ncbi:MAG TPA: 5-(carboxyamino)imidazole ribonucleotide mutase [Candidatus Avimonoglobus intestinipullorum]|uniref:N5-carboxyaminoimidazole ribonucleotide mutase n=1 Tax=Candidatus Avimonoglobus intestinipullorum TaxID=2840699 RepID=A0A9D1LW84_9FIRM|nr:5-(carboxyamino)imidazole ribonucleotide mutase [Candidatus Avimonoglobus intestinipullorum]
MGGNNMSNPKVAIVMGSDSDFDKLKGCIKVLKRFNIEVDVNVISAHRTPEQAEQFAKSAEENGIEVIIAAAGKAAHLGGVLAAFTTLPVIGVPIKSSTMDGMDSLLSMVQMPKGIPVATVAIDGGDNAGILAAQMLSLKYDSLKAQLKQFKKEMAEEVLRKNEKIKAEAAEL